jgi:hypothetical protein
MNTNILMQKIIPSLVAILLSLCAWAQPASVSVPVSIGRTTCGSGTGGVAEYNYNGATNVMTNLSFCQPVLASPGFSTSLTGDAFNPKDSSLYIVRTRYSSGVPTTYIWRYKMPSCPATSVPVMRTFAGWDIAGLVFDRDGVGYWIEFVGAAAPYKLGLRKVDIVANTIGILDTLNQTSSVGSFNMWDLSGDVALTPKGIMYAAYNNKMFTIDYNAYDNNPATKIPTTYIDTVRSPTATHIVGLCYADGKMIASYARDDGAAYCGFREINLLNTDTSIITYTGGVTAYDFTSIVSSLGVSKDLISSVPTGTPGEYDLEYHLKIQNLGNTPLDTIQVTDNLQTVFGPGNVTVTSVSYVLNPGTLFLNAAYNGIAVTSLFTNVGANVSRLRNFPTSMSTCIISIRCRVRNIVPGITYNNSATGTARGYRNNALRDVSTDGTTPDLDGNDKSDDVGEDQPTPFIISVAPQAPPCDSLNQVIYSQDFGTGTTLTSVIPGTSRTNCTAYGGTIPIPSNAYALTNNANNGYPARWISLSDHTGNTNGRMMVINADNQATRIFFDTINVTCTGFKYSFFAWTAFLGNSIMQDFCNGTGGYNPGRLTFIARNATTGRIIANLTTPDITSGSWERYGMKFAMPAGVTRIVLEIINSAPGGCGNDIALDDIQYGRCDVVPTVNASGTDGCLGGSTTFDVTLTDTIGLSSSLTYQWQRSNDNISWTNIGGAVNINYTINPILPTDSRYYRLVVSNGSPSCQFISPGYFLNLKTLSVTPASVLKSKDGICPGETVTLRVNGGSLGTNASWRWYSGSCGGTFVGSGTTLTVNPTATTTYFVRAEGDCNNTNCRQVTININCDIDDDDDGIPDIVENNGVDVEEDDDLDGVDDRYDFDSDGIVNQYDRDSDNDGIPDAVESAGADANGNGRIDNYTDTDADGFSQNVDGNTSGHLLSGNGLGRLDIDGDGFPNFLDLDSDGDGIPDIREAGGADINNNGRVDTFTDPDGDGYSNIYDTDIDNDGTTDNTNAILMTGADVNSDGRADSYPNDNPDRDARANPYDLDSDGDGLSDVLEVRYGQIKISGTSLFVDANNDGFVDGPLTTRGWNSAIAATGSLSLPNNDADIYPDFLDIDADGDGITDNIEAQTTFLPGAAYLIPAAADADNDGVDDQYDSNTSAYGSPRLTALDTDSDGTPDYLDLDTDADSQPDIVEGNDFNQNRINDDFITPANVDTDGDGLDNTFDNDNVNPYVTSTLLGSGGSFSGPSPFGTRSVVTRSYAFQYDRDWRYNGMILSVNLLQFGGNLHNNASHLYWSISAAEPIARMTIERSGDGVNFNTVGTLAGTSVLNTVLSFTFDDRLQTPLAPQYYYRVRITGVSGREKTTQIILLRPTQRGNNLLEVTPVPAVNWFNITVKAARAQQALVQLVDMNGQVVMHQQEKLSAGQNVINFNDAQRFSSGVYQVRVWLDGEWLHTRLVIR